LEDKVPEVFRGEIEQLRCTLVSREPRGAVHVVPRALVGIVEVCEIKIDHIVSGWHVNGGIDMVVTIVGDYGWILNTLDCVRGIGMDVYQDVAGGPGPGRG